MRIKNVDQPTSLPTRSWDGANDKASGRVECVDSVLEQSKGIRLTSVMFGNGILEIYLHNRPREAPMFIGCNIGSESADDGKSSPYSIRGISKDGQYFHIILSQEQLIAVRAIPVTQFAAISLLRIRSPLTSSSVRCSVKWQHAFLLCCNPL